jgi:hypothetical protein
MIAWLWAYHIKYRVHHAIDLLLRWIAWHLPRKLVMWCYVRVGAHATTGAYGDTVVPDLGMMEALRRWDA